jgi:hypothetical protein
MIVPPGGIRVWKAMPRALVTSAAVGVASAHRAGELALAGRVLGDVGDPQLVRPGAAEVALDQVGAAHQQRDGVVADRDPMAKPQLGMDPQCAVVPREAWWISAMWSVSQAWRIARCEGGRDRQA